MTRNSAAGTRRNPIPVTVIGLSHRTAPVEIRERVALAAAQQERMLGELLDRVEESVILSTCNRTELYVAGERADLATHEMAELLIELEGFSAEDILPYLYRLRDKEAVTHLFTVASGLDSMILGEPQILGQVRTAYETAVASHSVGPVLSRVFHHALRVGKLVRSSTGIGRHAASVSYAVVEQAREALGELANRSMVVIGTGKIGELTARTVRAHGMGEIVAINRTHARALELAKQVGGRAAEMADLPELLARVDLVVASTDSPEYVVTRQLVERAMKRREGRNLLLIDVSVPRNVEPSVRELEGVQLYNIDALKERCETGIEGRRREVDRAREIIQAELAACVEWWASREVAPTIAALRQRADEIRRAELERALARMGSLSEQQRRAVEGLSIAIVNKMLHGPTVRLKGESLEGRGTESAEVLRRLFGTGESAAYPPSS